jgi:hypothetical protein
MSAAVLVTVFLLWGGLAGCRREADQPAQQPAQPEPYSSRIERGPATVEVTADRRNLTIAEHVRLTIRVAVPADYEVELPAFGDKLEQFGIVDYTTPQPRLVDEGRVVRERTYVLEPFLSGEYVVPPMTVYFWKRDGEEPRAHDAETEEFKVTVRSLLPEQLAELTIRDMLPPVELAGPSRRGVVMGVIGGAVAILAAAFGLWWWWRRRRRAETADVPRVCAHGLAYRQLEHLVAADLVARGRTKTFFLALSAVLRHYIENRFGAAAPERTTEEFLAEIRDDPRLPPAQRPMLQEFLVLCDQVKFAEHMPATLEIQRAFDLCKEFIAVTADETVQVPVPDRAWASPYMEHDPQEGTA